MTDAVLLVVSVDTEEDNWAPAREGITVENIRELPRMDRLLEQLGARATWFTTYQVVANEMGAEIMQYLAENGRCEIGAHLHPWNTPPIGSELTAWSTMMANLPQEEQVAKIGVLTEAIKAAIGERPRVFRAGRWGLDAGTARALLSCGYEVDSSVTPFRSWAADSGPSHVGAPLNVYRLDGLGDHRLPVPGGKLVEVPTSWGYRFRYWRSLEKLHLLLEKRGNGRGGALLSLAGKLHIINNVVLSPEMESVPQMMRLAKRLLQRGARHLHLTFHSPSLRPGLSPFTRSSSDVDRLYGRLSSVIEGVASLTPIRFATVGEAASTLGAQA